MIKKLFFLTLIFLLKNATAQFRFGNEWIVNSQQYFKIEVTRNGIYRISYNTLQAAGIPVSAIDPRLFQVFYLGKEQAIYVAGEQDGIFSPGDYIEFYGIRNDGRTDAELFSGGAAQVNPYYSFVSDTSVYFLTWKNTGTAKRVSNYSNTAYGSFTPQPYYMHRQLIYGQYDANFSDNAYSYGIPTYAPASIQGSEYTTNEGYTLPWVGLGGSTTYKLPVTNYITGVAKPVLSTTYSGQSDDQITTNGKNHHVQLWLDNVKLTDDSFRGFYTKTITTRSIDTPISLTANTLLTLKSINDLFLTADWNSLAFAELLYPRAFELNNTTAVNFSLTASQQYVWWKNFGNGSKNNPVVYDIANAQRITASAAGTDLKIIFPSTSVDKEVFVCDTTDIQYVSIKPVTMPNVNTGNNYDYIIITSDAFLTVAGDYKNYNATRYKPFNTLVITSNELYNGFYYGMHHPLAVRHFCDYLLENAGKAPQYLLLLGKGEQTNTLRNPFNYSLDYVPSLGVPCSDHMFTNGLKGSALYEPAISTGRIACKTTAEAQNYLQKLKDYEAVSDTASWKKNVLHLLGGADAFQSGLITGVMNQDAAILSKSYTGAKVITMNKNSTSPVDSSLEQAIISQVNSGIGLLNFFGHGSLNETDIKFGEGCQWNNYKKYPVMFLNGCNVGNCNIAYQVNGSQNRCPASNPGNIASKGEVFVMEKDKGAIAWIAQANTTTTNSLTVQIDSIYPLIATTMYGESIGNIIKQMIYRTTIKTPANSDLRNHSLQLVLQGDPALRLFTATKPDYKISSPELFLYPYNSTAASDSFAIAIPVTNFGKALNDSIEVKVKRTYGSVSVEYPVQVSKPILHDDIYYFYIRSKDPKTTGINKFEVWIDPNNKISELNESNNYAQLSFYLPGNGVHLIAPAKYGIVTSNNITLEAQSSNLFSGTNQFFFELDTTPYFNSPFLKRSPLINAPHRAQWNVLLPGTDSAVYYWRARLNLPDTAGGFWQQQSFTVIKNASEGWNQSHFLQYLGIQSSNLVIDTLKRSINFMPVKRKFTVNTQRYAHCNRGFTLDGFQGGLNAGVCGGMNLVVMEVNQYTLDPELDYLSPCRNYNIQYKQFYMTLPSQQQAFRDYINQIKDGQFVGIYTRYNPDFPSWDSLSFSAIESLGFTKTVARKVNDYFTSYVAIGQKGGGRNGFVPVEDTMHYLPALPEGCGLNPDSLNPILEISTSLIGSDKSGDMESEMIGPSASWSTIYRRYGSQETNLADTLYIDVFGLGSDKTTETLLYYGINKDSFDIHLIDAARFPYIKLLAHLKDNINRTAPVFKGWQVRYVGLPEGTLDPADTNFPFVFEKDTLMEGDSVLVKYAFTNISNHAFKSPLAVQYTINEINKGYKVKQKEFTDSIYTILAPKDTLRITRKISTRGLTEKNVLDVFVNPQIQAEEYYANNSFSRNFYVRVDRTRLLLDVTIDGMHIRNNDIVSPSPIILISAKDENPSLLLDDSSKFLLLLKRPGATNTDTIRFTDPDILFVPSSKSAVNKAIIEYNPKNLKDGLYTLRVQAYDRAGNVAGSNMYEINFQVINEQTATRFYPYPNPFSTSMHFVFTLTGIIPDDIYIQIMTVSGKVVKTITRQELGFIHLGHNITEWGWDGTDEFGDKLANGVYLYRVYVKEDGKDVKHNSTLDTKGFDASKQYFIKDVGKIYILR